MAGTIQYTVVGNGPNSFSGPKNQWNLEVYYISRNDTSINFGRQIILDEKSKFLTPVL